MFSHKVLYRKLDDIIELLQVIACELVPQESTLSQIKIIFERNNLMAAPLPGSDPVTLQPGQSTTAKVLYFDQNGNPMPSSFIPPSVSYSIDHPEFASSTPQADGQSDLVAYVSAGVAQLTATVQGPNGPLSDSETVTCAA